MATERLVVAALEAVPGLVVVVDGEDLIVDATRAVTGSILELVHASSAAPLAVALAATRRDGTTRTIDLALQRAPSGLDWCHTSLVAWKTYVVVSMTPITDRYALEQRLRRAEALMVDTQGTAHLGTWEWSSTCST